MMNLFKRKEYLFLVLILASVFLINTVSYENGHDWGGDFSQYINQAKSLVEGNTDKLLEDSLYRYENSDDQKIGPLLYPWGFPILLSSIYYAFGLNIFAMKVFTNIFFIFSLITVFFTFRGKIGSFQNFMIILLISLNPYFFNFKESIVSDIPFMFFSLCTIFLIQKILIADKVILNYFISYSLIGIFIFISFSIRSSGIILLTTLFTVQYFEKAYSSINITVLHWRNAIHLLPYLVFLILTVSLGEILPNKATYPDQLSLITIKGIEGNIHYYSKLMSVFFSIPLNNFGQIVYCVTIPFVLLGVFKRVKDNYIYFIFSIFTVTLYIIWPGVQGLRFLFPIIPFYLFFLFVGLNEIKLSVRLFNMLKPIRINLSLIFGISLILIFGIFVLNKTYQTISLQEKIINGPYSNDSLELFNYITSNTDKDDAIVFFKPRVMLLYTGRKSIRLGNFFQIKNSDAKYIVCRRNANLDLLIQNHQETAEKIFENNTFCLYSKF